MIDLAARRWPCVYEAGVRSADVKMQRKAQRTTCPYSRNRSAVPSQFDRDKLEIQKLIKDRRNSIHFPFLITRSL
jgi:hypothetical protein